MSSLQSPISEHLAWVIVETQLWPPMVSSFHLKTWCLGLAESFHWCCLMLGIFKLQMETIGQSLKGNMGTCQSHRILHSTLEGISLRQFLNNEHCYRQFLIRSDFIKSFPPKVMKPLGKSGYGLPGWNEYYLAVTQWFQQSENTHAFVVCWDKISQCYLTFSSFIILHLFSVKAPEPVLISSGEVKQGRQVANRDSKSLIFHKSNQASWEATCKISRLSRKRKLDGMLKQTKIDLHLNLTKFHVEKIS